MIMPYLGISVNKFFSCSRPPAGARREGFSPVFGACSRIIITKAGLIIAEKIIYASKKISPDGK